MHSQKSYNSPKLKKVDFLGSNTCANLTWSNGHRSAINLETADNEACIYESSLVEESGSRIVMTGCAEEVKELLLTSVTYGIVFAIVNLDGSVNELQIDPIVDRTKSSRQIRPPNVDKNQSFVDTIDNFDDFDK